MPSYLLQVSYTSQAFAANVNHPQPDRIEYLRKIIAKLGGTIDSFWLSFGDYDTVAILTLPDNVSAATLTNTTAPNTRAA